MLLDKPIESHPIEPNAELPPPSALRRKIIIKNKKKHHHHHHHHHKKNATSATAAAIAAAGSSAANRNAMAAAAASAAPAADTDASDSSPQSLGNGSAAGAGAGGAAGPITPLPSIVTHAPPLQQIRQSSKESTGSSDTDSSSDDESVTTAIAAPVITGVVQPDKVAAAKETEAGAEISALVNYVQPVHFSSFENSESKCGVRGQSAIFRVMFLSNFRQEVLLYTIRATKLNHSFCINVWMVGVRNFEWHYVRIMLC